MKSFNFAESLAGVPKPTMTAAVDCVEDVSDLKAECDSQFGTATLEPHAEAKNRYRLAVVPRNDLSVGHHNTNVRIQATNRAGKVVGQEYLPAAIHVVGALRFTPETIHLGSLSVNSLSRQVVLSQFRAGGRFRIKSVAGPDSGLLTVKLSRSEDSDKLLASHNLELEIAPSRIGAHSSAIRITAMDEKNETSVFELPVTFVCLGKTSR
ncbi:MAG: hypothetical protein U0903_03680 [Planctomycetales bacterium]